MITFHRLTLTALAAATAFTAAPAMAGSNHGGVGNVPGPDFPPNAAPGQCFSRRVTGAGGAYRWDRIECDSAYQQGGYGHEQWGYGGGRIEVETRPSYGYGYGYQGVNCDPCSVQGGGYTGGYQQGGYRYENPCDPCAGYGGYTGGGYQGGYAYGGGYAGDRYGERRYDSRYSQSQYDQSQYEYGSSAYSGGYAYGRGGQGVSYPPPYGYGYVAAGRDEAGYLIWPGKTP